jgi:flagellar motor switch protein FliM
VSELLSQQERELLSTPIQEAPKAPFLNVFPNAFPDTRQNPVVDDEITDEQLNAIESFHQSVAKRFSIGLSDFLQRIVDVQLRAVVLDTYSKFIFSRSTPTCLVTLTAHPLRESLGIDYSPSILYVLLDCMLGGGRHAADIPSRPVTQIEQQLAKRVTTVLLAELRDAWEHVLAVDLAIENVESNAQRVRLVAPSDPAITMTFQTRVAEQSGDITLCLPLRSIRKMIMKLSGSVDNTENQLASVRASLGPIHILSDDLQKLCPGELLVTDLPANSLAEISIDGEHRFKAKPASMLGKKAVVVEEML